MWPNLPYARAHESKVARVFRAGLGKCGACAGAPTPREKRSGPAGCSTYLPLERSCSDAVENERVGAQLQVHEIETGPVSRRVPAPAEQLSQRAHRPILQTQTTSSWQLRGAFLPNQPRSAHGLCRISERRIGFVQLWVKRPVNVWVIPLGVHFRTVKSSWKKSSR